jgi:hypothetical protein
MGRVTSGGFLRPAAGRSRIRADATREGLRHAGREKSTYDLECIGCHVTGWQTPGGFDQPGAVGDRRTCSARSVMGRGAHVKAGDWARARLKADIGELCPTCHTPAHSTRFRQAGDLWTGSVVRAPGISPVARGGAARAAADTRGGRPDAAPPLDTAGPGLFREARGPWEIAPGEARALSDPDGASRGYRRSRLHPVDLRPSGHHPRTWVPGSSSPRVASTFRVRWQAVSPRPAPPVPRLAGYGPGQPPP